MYARVPQAMAQFVLKIEKLSHIMAPTPILEIARAYGAPSLIIAPGYTGKRNLYKPFRVTQESNWISKSFGKWIAVNLEAGYLQNYFKEKLLFY